MNITEARAAIKAAMHAVEVPSPVAGATIKTIEYGLHGSVTKGTVINVAKRTYGGVPGWAWEVRERGAHGRRTHYVWWLAKAEYQRVEWEAGTLTAYTVTGNYRGSTFQELSTTHEIKIEGLELS